MVVEAGERTIDAVAGCFFGGAIGDAAGTAFENEQQQRQTDAFDFNSWRLSDDTQLTLATCEAILSFKSPDPEAIAKALLRWHRQRRLTGLGASTLKALRDLEAGNHWALSGRGGERAAGNGAAMRIAPLAFIVDPEEDAGRRLIRDVARITHQNDEAYVGSLAVVFAIHAARVGPFQITEIASKLPDTLVRDRLREIAALPVEVGIVEAASRFGASGYVVESVPLALFAARQAEEIGYTAMLQELLSAGGDADTNASIAGQIVGARIGLNGLPKELVDRLPEREMIMDIAAQFAKHVAAA